MATKTMLLPLAAMFGCSYANLPYKRQREAVLDRLKSGRAYSRAMWVEAVAIATQKHERRNWDFVRMVEQIVAEGALDAHIDFLPTEEDKETAREIERKEYPTPRYLATLAYGYEWMSAAEKDKMQRRVAFYLENTDPVKERDWYNKLCDCNPAMAAVLRMRWRKANGLPKEDALPVTAAEKLAVAMNKRLDPARKLTTRSDDPFEGVSFDREEVPA